MTYQVKLDVFEGPIDLLLQLITRQRLEIYDISLATITQEYLRVVDEMESIDLEIATGFLLVAATLLELKSTRLLPSGGAEGANLELLEERDLLLSRLIECSTFREAGAWISAAFEKGADFHGRAVPLELRFLDLAPDLLHNVSAARLAKAADRALAIKAVPQLDTSHLAPIRVSVREAIAEVSDQLQTSGQMSFEEICAGVNEKMVVIVRFLALLELVKSGAILLEQATRFGVIHAMWTGEVDPDHTMDAVDEYSLDQGGQR